MDIGQIRKTLHPLEQRVLPLLAVPMNIDMITDKAQLQEVEVRRALQWLENKKLVSLAEEPEEAVVLEKNGLLYIQEGLPERRFLNALKDKPISLAAVQKAARLEDEEVHISLGLLKKKGAITLQKADALLVSLNNEGKVWLRKALPEEDFLKKKFPLSTGTLSPEERQVLTLLVKRKQIVRIDITKTITASLTSEGKKLLALGLDQSQETTEETLTQGMLKTGSWQKKRFRHYDVVAPVPRMYGGKRHFTRQAVDYIKRIWLDLGFREMTGSLIQTSFWDLDALFVPQDHPARDMQDTFYLKRPKKGSIRDKALEKRIKKTHESGWTTGSSGWQSPWSEERARENLLRTHTTVLSAQAIAQLKKKELPAKFFSVGKVFRNETLDWKHLFEFYQVEGIVVDPDATFCHLIGYLTDFYKKMGYPKVRIRPAHFPYTEPSAEVEVFHPVRKEWIELGGSGIFRPEVVKPLLGIDVPVLAWGQGMGRIISEYWGITDIRELYKNDLKFLRESKMLIT
ncbi:phenylalanine--tRNA ligase subunit alpha [Candidatus Woesearchaeota archaeon CG_4_10_14_0_8_um_filter_47_5]|nr:MAG: phenylalanine--tRNA ligase subunit alpha [Candidatus Woesearchaeota archaeon CG_4_10_14_0_8_um_filter_47_5]